MTSTPAARAVRSIRNDRISPAAMEVRRNETVRDGFRPHDEGQTAEIPTAEMPTAETAVFDRATGRYYELTARQMTAIHLLTMGKSVVATAKSLEIGVSTLHRWKSKQPAFVAELNRRQHEVFERTVDKLRQTMSKAVDELFNLMQSRNARERYEVAMKLLPMMQPRKWIVPTGPSDADAVMDEQIREKRVASGEEATAEITEDEREAAIAEAEAALGSSPPDRHPERSEGPGSSCDNRRSKSQVLRCAQDDESTNASPLEGGSSLPLAGTEGTAEAEAALDSASLHRHPERSEGPGSSCDNHRFKSQVLRCAQDDDLAEPPDLRNARTHAERVSVRPVDSSTSSTGIPACDSNGGGRVTA